MLPINTIDKTRLNIIVLTGGRDFGRCLLATRLPTALWPVAGSPALERLLENLTEQGIRHVTICSNGDSSLIRNSIGALNGLKINYLDEPLPVGTAGAVRDASRSVGDSLILVVPANIVQPPAVDTLISIHQKGGTDMTVMFNSADNDCRIPGQAVGIYVFDSSILKYIPEDGYFDIKEGLIPALVRDDRTIRAATLPRSVGVFHNRWEYLDAIGIILADKANLKGDFKPYSQNDAGIIWKQGNVTVEPKARIHGPVAIMDGAHISKNAVISGPTIVGRNVTVEEGALIANSVLWDNAHISSGCRINKCILDYSVRIKRGTLAEEKVVTFKPERTMSKVIRRAGQNVREKVSRHLQTIEQRLFKATQKTPAGRDYHKRAVTFGLVATAILALLWSYWPSFVDLWRIWQRSDEYSSGLLVPFLAVYILWSRRDKIKKVPIRPCLWGALAFVFAQAVRLLGLFFMYGSAERLSIVLSIAALVLMMFGWQLFKKTATIFLFLCLMLPWPNRVQAAMALPMQKWATTSAVFCLEMLGYSVIREGNIIHIGQASVAVAEACNGLRMVMAFFVTTGLVVLLVKRAWWEKLIVLISSLPIALLCNTIRLTVTAIAFTVLTGENWEKIFHDFGGYAMMPMALAAVVLELWLITKLTTAPEDSTAEIITGKIGTQQGR
jgi:exosortase